MSGLTHLLYIYFVIYSIGRGAITYASGKGLSGYHLEGVSR